MRGIGIVGPHPGHQVHHLLGGPHPHAQVLHKTPGIPHPGEHIGIQSPALGQVSLHAEGREALALNQVPEETVFHPEELRTAVGGLPKADNGRPTHHGVQDSQVVILGRGIHRRQGLGSLFQPPDVGWWGGSAARSPDRHPRLMVAVVNPTTATPARNCFLPRSSGICFSAIGNPVGRIGWCQPCQGWPQPACGSRRRHLVGSPQSDRTIDRPRKPGTSPAHLSPHGQQGQGAAVMEGLLAECNGSPQPSWVAPAHARFPELLRMLLIFCVPAVLRR